MKFYNYNSIVKFSFLIIICSFWNMDAQTIRGFGNYSMYVNENKEKIKEIQLGSDYMIYPGALQVSFSYINNRKRHQENYDYDNYVLEKLTTKASALNFGIGLKLYNLFSDYDVDYHSELGYYIMPKFNVARISASENFNSTNYFKVLVLLARIEQL